MTSCIDGPTAYTRALRVSMAVIYAVVVFHIFAGATAAATEATAEPAIAEIQDSQGGVIVGRIVGPDSAPVVGARVVVVGGIHSAATDSVGNFVLTQTPPGTQVLEFVHVNYESFRLSPVAMPVGDTLRLTAMLQLAPRSGREADSVRAVRVARGGRGGQAQDPILLMNGVIRTRTAPDGAYTTPDPAEADIVAIDILTGNAAMEMFGSRAYFGTISIVTRPPCRPDGTSPMRGVRCKSGSGRF